MQSLVNKDLYRGEFDEYHMDILLDFCHKNEFAKAKEYIDETLKRKDFIFGSARSDFLYFSNIDKNSVCLDVGCGLGVHTFNMAKIAKEVHSLDLSKKRVEFCEYRAKEEKMDNIEFYHSDIDSLPFKENTFDFIAMNGVVEWLGEQNKNKDPRQDQIDGLRKIYSLLKKGGMLYIGIENRFALTYLHNAKDHNRLKYTTFMPRFLANMWTKWKINKLYRTYTYSKFGYEKLLSDSGFNKKNINFYIAHPGYNLPKYMIDFDDVSAFKFFFEMVFSGKNFLSELGFIYKNKYFIKIARHLFYSYDIFTIK
jgi:ubiquinone/menaquinone biosynthesis C-methylase UbiE